MPVWPAFERTAAAAQAGPGDRMPCFPPAFGLALVMAIVLPSTGATVGPDGYHVHPGESLQEALDAAARNPKLKQVKVHAGEYRPDSRRQALIWLNRAHDGIQLEAVGRVTLMATNPRLSDPGSPSHPAVVNHVVYFGDGISSNTVFRGFRIIGANNFVTTDGTSLMEPETNFPKGHFFYSDGGAIKIYGRSYPRIRDLEIVDNYASPCAGGISIERYGQDPGKDPQEVLIENCLFRNNRSRIMGAAVDLLPGVAVRLVNCLFVGNSANLGSDYLSPEMGFPPGTNSAVLTIFSPARVTVQNCTFTGNRNAVDDRNTNTVYLNCIFWRNDLNTGVRGGERYELELLGRARASGCFFGGRVIDRHRSLSGTENIFNAPDPDFDERFVPRSPLYRKAGYRPVVRLVESGEAPGK